MNSDGITQLRLLKSCKQSRAVPPQCGFVHEAEVLTVRLALGSAPWFLEDVIVRIPRHPRGWIAVGIVHRVFVQLDAPEPVGQPAHTQHARIVRAYRDEIEVILVERALKV